MCDPQLWKAPKHHIQERPNWNLYNRSRQSRIQHYSVRRHRTDYFLLLPAEHLAFDTTQRGESIKKKPQSPVDEIQWSRSQSS